MDILKQQAPANIFKIDDPPNFQIQVASGHLQKPIATATRNFYVGDQRSYLCKTFRQDEEFDRALYRVGLHETQQCGHRHYTWSHPFPTLDNASQKRIEWNEC